MPISTKHPSFDKYNLKWEKIKKVIANDAQDYINPIESENEARTKRYREEAILTNFTERTRNAFCGVVFRKDPEYKLPDALKFILDDATPDGLTLYELVKSCLSELIEIGRVGILVDYPRVDAPISVKQVREQKIHAKLCKYDASSIINWSTIRKNGRIILSLIVLREETQVLQKDFSWQSQTQYRVLMLDDDGNYVQRLYNDKEELIDEFYPLRGDGNYWQEIPFVFIGSENNKPEINKPTLYDLALLNIGHYRNSADVEEMAHLIGQPMLAVTTDLTQEQFNQTLGGKALVVGSRRGLNLGTNGTAFYVQPNESQLSDNLMKRKEEQAVMIGARLITPNNGIETAEAARMRYGSENSVLYNIVKNLDKGIEYCLYYVAIFENYMQVINNPDLIQYKLNDQFFETKLSALEISAAIQLYDRGIMSNQDLFYTSKLAGLIESGKELDKTLQEIEDETPLIGYKSTDSNAALSATE